MKRFSGFFFVLCLFFLVVYFVSEGIFKKKNIRNKNCFSSMCLQKKNFSECFSSIFFILTCLQEKFLVNQHVCIAAHEMETFSIMNDERFCFICSFFFLFLRFKCIVLCMFFICNGTEIIWLLK